ncbi:MAG: hypothetical protein QG571_487, partial [Pseudomonadota bacterium]|nr:hypothetical protein [Pseudomonadota bacterium]
MSGKSRAYPPRHWINWFFLVLLVSILGVVAGCGDDDGKKSKNPVPVLTSVSPTAAVAGGAGFTLTTNGTGFVLGSVVHWNGATRTTTFVSGTQLTAAIPASDIASAGTAQVTVVSPTPGGGTSSPVAFTIDNPAPGNPVPVVTSLSPAKVVAGSAAFDLIVTGTGFVQGATVQWNGTNRATTFVSTTQVQAAIAVVDVVDPVSVPVTVTNPAPTVGTSNALIFVVTTPPMPGVPVPITVAPDGSPPNGPSVNGGLSFMGRHVVFASKASNLVPDDTYGAWDVFVRVTCMDYWTRDLLDGCTPKTTRISVAPDGSQADGDSGSTVASPAGSLAVSFDGRYVAYVSSATNLVAGDTNGVDDVFLRDTCLDDRFGAVGGCTPVTVRVSLRNDGTQSSAAASAPAIGVDGGHVVFVSADPSIVSGDANGVVDVFLRDVCPSATSGCTPGTRRISVASGGVDANGTSGSPVFTGRYVAFTSVATNLVAGDSNSAVDVFMRDTCIGAESACTPSTERISLGSDGAEANGASSEPLVGLPMGSMSGYDYHGRFVVFASSATNLVAGDTNGVADVFMRDTCRGRPGCVPSTQRVSLTSTGQQIVGQPSGQPGHMRWDGQEVIFVTAADGVVPDDTNGVEDVFMRGVCQDTTTCVRTTTRRSEGEQGLQCNGASFAPRG